MSTLREWAARTAPNVTTCGWSSIRFTVREKLEALATPNVGWLTLAHCQALSDYRDEVLRGLSQDERALLLAAGRDEESSLPNRMATLGLIVGDPKLTLFGRELVRTMQEEPQKLTP